MFHARHVLLASSLVLAAVAQPRAHAATIAAPPVRIEAAARALPLTEFTFESPTRFRLVARTADGATATLEALGATRLFGVEAIDVAVNGVPSRFYSWYDEQHGARIFLREGAADGFILPGTRENRAFERGLADLLSQLDPRFADVADDLLAWREGDVAPTMHSNGAQSGGSAPSGGATGGSPWGAIIDWVIGLFGGGGEPGGGLVSVGGGDDNTNKGDGVIIVIKVEGSGNVIWVDRGSGSGQSSPGQGGSGSGAPPSGGGQDGGDGSADDTGGGENGGSGGDPAQ